MDYTGWDCTLGCWGCSGYVCVCGGGEGRGWTVHGGGMGGCHGHGLMSCNPPWPVYRGVGFARNIPEAYRPELERGNCHIWAFAAIGLRFTYVYYLWGYVQGKSQVRVHGITIHLLEIDVYEHTLTAVNTFVCVMLYFMKILFASTGTHTGAAIRFVS